MRGYSTCYSHRPDLAGERRRNASKGGRSGGRGRPQTEIAAIKQQIRSVIAGVIAGKIPQGPGAVALQGLNTLLRAHEMERRQEVGRNITPEELERLMATVVELVGRHVPESERLRAFLEDIDALLDEDSG
ncbi:MAG: hypothetical protein M3Q49_20220 [Actinomycetota bacterium]|nr:hypothetical protein [Actinomycetota bacterium]